MKEQLLAFDVSLYEAQLKQAKSVTNSRLASQMIRSAILKDSVGMITEMVSAESVFTPQEQLRFQLTPQEHRYIKSFNPHTKQQIMTCPEHFLLNKDITSVLSDWRRGLDKKAMEKVKPMFFDAKVGDTFYWCSPKSEKWEGELINKYNSAYGFLYVGQVVEQDGNKMMLVHDFKSDINTKTYQTLLQNLSPQKINFDPQTPLLDQVMTTVVKTEKNLTDSQIWKMISQTKKEVMGEDKILNEDLNVILEFQDRELHQDINSQVAPKIADWLISKLEAGIPSSQLQPLIKNKFISETLKVVRDYKTDSSTNFNYTGKINYSGSFGKFCGGWGSSTTRYVNPFGLEGGSEVLKCENCGFENTCNKHTCANCDKSIKKGAQITL